MNSISPANRRQPGLGAFIILLYALYGAYISSLYILVGDKGGRPSADFYIFAIVFLLIALSNLGNLLIQRVASIDKKSILLLFICYLSMKVFMDITGNSIVRIGDLIKSIGMNFIIGFIAFTIFKSKLPIMSGVMANLQSIKWIRRIAIMGSISFIGLNLYFIAMFLGTSIRGLFSEFRMIHLSNDYYQDFGDYMAIAFCCLVSLQMLYLKNITRPFKAFYVFLGFITFQTCLTFVCLQSIGSNKSVALIVIICMLAIYLSKPDGWLIRNGRVRINALFAIPLLLIVILLAYKYTPLIDSSNLHIYDRGESSSVLINSSMQSRIYLIDKYFIEQFENAPIFGDISYTPYMHSSLLSIQTHLGMIGSFLFWSFTILQLPQVYRSRGNEGLKAIALPILFVSIISSLFTWGPLWFLLGALYAFNPQTQDQFHPSYTYTFGKNVDRVA